MVCSTTAGLCLENAQPPIRSPALFAKTMSKNMKKLSAVTLAHNGNTEYVILVSNLLYFIVCIILYTVSILAADVGTINLKASYLYMYIKFHNCMIIWIDHRLVLN